jgi:hypothetical protein
VRPAALGVVAGGVLERLCGPLMEVTLGAVVIDARQGDQHRRHGRGG